MTHLKSGYVKDLAYTYGYFSELNPLNVKLKFLNAGISAPEFGTACELGFGQGLSINIHAAASLCSWFGTDFNSEQALFAREIASASSAEIQLFGEAFAEFVNRDLPNFDYIGLHGIWSWISDENREIILDFIRRKLNVGGVVYIGYNTLPGWSTFAPIRHLMKTHVEITTAENAEIINHISSAVEFTEKLLSTKPMFARANPLIEERVNKIKGQNRIYLTHEYFNEVWNPSHFSSMVQMMAEANLSYGCSASYLDHIEVVNLTSEQLKFLAEIKDPVLKETARDFMVNRYFRRDYWIKNSQALTAIEQIEGIRELRLVMTAYRPEVEMKIIGNLGEAILTEKIYSPVLDLMADHKIRNFYQIEQAVKNEGISFSQLVEIIMVLCHKCILSLAQDEEIITEAKKTSDRVNSYLILQAITNKEIVFLASPVTGGGVNVDWVQQLFLLAFKHGKQEPRDQALFVIENLELRGQLIITNGITLNTREEQLFYLTNQAYEFKTKFLPIFEVLQIL